MIPKNTIRILIFVLALIAENIRGAEVRALMFGGTKVGLGMPKNEAISELSKSHSVTLLDEGGYLIQEKKTGGEGSAVLGYIHVRDDVVRLVSRNPNVNRWPSWGAYSMGRALYEALDIALPETDRDGAKRSIGRIVIAHRDGVGEVKDIQTVDIYINSVKISMSLMDHKETKIASVMVVIQAEPW
jgi:hypothetical protein